MGTMEHRVRVLLVEADPSVVRRIVDWLERDGLVVDTVAGPAEFATPVANYGVVVIGLPDGDRLALCRTLRADDRGARILMLVPDRTEAQSVAALEAGADDVLGREGLSTRELAVRVRALARRPRVKPRQEQSGILTVGCLQVDVEQGSVVVDGFRAQLSAVELAVLMELVARPGEVVHRADVVHRVWGTQPVEPRTVDTVVKRLRARLGEAGSMVETVRGVGYRLDPQTRIRPASA
jgi:DNA-binding response OmpR family regulator